MRIVKRTILMGELAFINLEYNELFIPSVEEVWLDESTGKFTRMLVNRRHRFDAKSPYFRSNFRQVRFTWPLLFSADPATMFIKTLTKP